VTHPALSSLSHNYCLSSEDAVSSSSSFCVGIVSFLGPFGVSAWLPDGLGIASFTWTFPGTRIDFALLSLAEPPVKTSGIISFR